METMTETGTEKRVDELSKRMDFGFEQVHHRFERVDSNLERVDSDVRDLRVAITSLYRAMFVFTGTTVGSILAGIVVIVITSHS
jgi:hypothetical protein